MKRLAVVGSPVSHSLSPAMQNAALDALGLDWRYEALAVTPSDFPSLLARAPEEGFVGWNVTIPHKEEAYRRCRPDAVANAVGAVNTLRFGATAGTPEGFNTDVYGFEQLLAELGLPSPPKRALLLGAGGAARAAALALRKSAVQVVVATRSSRQLTLPGQPPFVHLTFREDELANAAPTVDLVVDATPRGLDSSSITPFSLGHLPRHAAVIDLVAKRTTPLVEAARSEGLIAATGAAMLLHQGARALELWTGRVAPVDVMRRALKHALDGDTPASRTT